MMGTSSAHRAVCAPVSERYVCSFLLFFLCGSVCFWVLLSHASLSVPILFHHQFHPLLRLTFRLLPMQLQTILFLQLLPIFCSLIFHHYTTLKFVESGLTTHCTWKTLPVASTQIHMSVHTPLFASSLITVPSRACRNADSFHPAQCFPLADFLH